MLRQRNYIIESNKKITVSIKEIPKLLADVLSEVGYKRRDIEITAADKIHLSYGGSDGRRAFVVICNLETGAHKSTYGSWGGPNMFNRDNAVDNDNKEYDIPENGAVIKGSEGGTSGVWADIYVNPKVLAKMLPSSGSDVTEREGKILGYFASYTSAGRARALKEFSVKQSEIDSLVARGFIKKVGNGLSITIAGKNSASKVY